MAARVLGARGAVRRDAGRRRAAHRAAPREPPRLLDVVGRRRAVRCDDRRHQPHASRRRARARHQPHRVPAHRHRDASSGVARRARPRRRRRTRPRRRRAVVRRRPRALRRRSAPHHQGEAVGPDLPAVHVGHHRRAEGGGVLAGTPRSHRHRPGGLAEPRARRRHLRVDAAVPLGRAVHRVGTDDRGRGDVGAAAALLRLGVPARRAQVRRHLLQLRGQAARLHPRHARAARRRRQPAATRVRQRRQRSRRAAVRSPLQLPAHRRVRADGDRRVDRAGAGHAGGLARQGHRRREGHQPRDRRRVPAGALRRRRQAAQRRGGHRRDRELRRAGLRGLLEERRGDARALPRRRLLDRRPRLPRRERLLLLRRSHRRLDPGRRRELRRGTGRAHPAALGAGGPARGVRRARPRARRPGDGGDPAHARRRVRRRRVRRLPRRAARPRHEVGADVRARSSNRCR